MDQKLTTFNAQELMLKADQKKLHILAIANGNINCSYRDAMQELNEYAEIVPQLQDGYLFLAGAKYLLMERFRNQNKDDAGTTM